MSFTIPEANVLQFGTNVRELAQQKGSRFRKAAIEDMVTGEAAYLEQLAPTAARKVIARHSDSPLMNTQHLRRRLSIYDYDWGDMVDRLDRVRLLIDPDSAYTKNASYAMGRGFDDEWIAAAFGTAYAGHSGSIALTWPNGNSELTPSQPGGTQVAVNDWSYGNGSGNAGLTISKLISAKVALMAAEVDDDDEQLAEGEYCVAVTAKHIGNLLSTTETTSVDYNSVKALVDGKINTFMGFKFIRSQRLLLNGSGYYRLPAWHRSAVGFGIAKDIETQSSPRPDKRFAHYIYCDMAIGAARLEEVKLVEVICV